MSFSMLKYIPTKPVNENILQTWLEARRNVLLVGLRGTGKTMQILHVFNKNYETRWAYFNGATCDPWTDLVGIPTADIGAGGLIFHRAGRWHHVAASYRNRRYALTCLDAGRRGVWRYALKDATNLPSSVAGCSQHIQRCDCNRHHRG